MENLLGVKVFIIIDPLYELGLYCGCPYNLHTQTPKPGSICKTYKYFLRAGIKPLAQQLISQALRQVCQS